MFQGRGALRLWLVVAVLLLVGCSTGPAVSGPVPTEEAAPPATAPAPIAAPAEAPTPVGNLEVSLLYPTEESAVTMGDAVKFTTQVTADGGAEVADAEVTVTVRDPDGSEIAEIPTVPGNMGVYRSEYWHVPHLTKPGTWETEVVARRGEAEASTSGAFQVENSTSEELLSKYGFWLDAPSLRNIDAQLCGEQGDARNGMICWGGVIAAQHVLPEAWVKIHWREGDYGLERPADVRRFLLEEVGDLGFRPIRDLGPFEPTRFKEWDAWQVGGRGQYWRDQMEWMIFYAPEVDKTFSIETTVVLPPAGIDPHSFLRESFTVDPSIAANGVAPEPLPDLLPPPELVSPSLGARFVGTDEPIVLTWEPLKALAPDEYYQVAVDFDEVEWKIRLKYPVWETQFTLPEELYSTPNCQVFNWRVTLMRQTGVGEDGQPIGEPISFNSLYWYVRWSYPPGAEKPFTIWCPNAQD